MLTTDQIRKQSESAYNQWCVQWRDHARQHSRLQMRSMKELANVGVGKACVCIANGYSFEEELTTLQKYAANVDTIVCDKTLGHALNNGIKPTYCFLADANVSYERYMEPWKDQLQDTILIANVCGNPKWSFNGNWKAIYFVAHEDVLKSEQEFMALSGCPNKIPAGTNVSNAMVVVLTQSSNDGAKNFFGYDKILLIGYDYCWSERAGYYAFDQQGGGKHNYMRHIYTWDINRDLVYTSNNLAFSAKWLDGYVRHFKLPVVQCSKRSILALPYSGRLDEQMQYRFRDEDAPRIKRFSEIYEDCVKAAKEAESSFKKIGREHHEAFLASV